MLLEIRLTHYVDPELLAVLAAIHLELNDMNTHLQSSIAALTAAMESNENKLEAVLASIPGLTAAAVTHALEAADVEEETAAGLIDEAVASMTAEVDKVAAAFPTAPAPAPEPTPAPQPDPASDVVFTGNAHGGDSTTEAAAGDESISGDAGNDLIDTGGDSVDVGDESVAAAEGDNTLGGGEGADTIDG